jgi:hypothetical protein
MACHEARALAVDAAVEAGEAVGFRPAATSCACSDNRPTKGVNGDGNGTRTERGRSAVTAGATSRTSATNR